MKYLSLFILLANITIAQNLDSLYNAILSLQETSAPVKNINNISSNGLPNKCGFTTIADAKHHFNQFSSEQQNKIQQILKRPEREKSIVSPSGFFRIHYDTTGNHVPDYFGGIANTIQLSVDSLAIALDSAYSFEVNYLGYLPPPSDGTDGGDNLYDVYISNLGYYGVTEWESVGNNKNKSFIKLDNKMNFYTTGISAARVTAAHEFHHAIQVGNYSDNTSGNVYYFEITSTSMEEFVYDSVNDYYGYLQKYFRNPNKRFTASDGYELAIWNIFLKEKFEQQGNAKKGFDIIKHTWELMRNSDNSALESISMALSENGLSLKNVFAEFSQWTYFTKHRAKQDKYFSEANNYPLIKPFATYKYQPPKKEYILSSEPMSNNFLLFDLSYTGTNDTLFSIITNCDSKNAELKPYKNVDYNYSLLTYGEDESKELFTDEFSKTTYYSKLESNKPEFLKESNIFNNEIVSGETVNREEINFSYPQPFNTTKHNYVFIPTKTNQLGTAKLTIYSASMSLVFNKTMEIYNSEKIVVRWDGKDNNGNKVASGIYIYVTDSDGKIIKGKLAIVN